MLKETVTRSWHLARRPLTTRRVPYMALNRMRSSRKDLLVRPDSSLLIEGPMRSGNTYATAAFRFANGSGLHIGRHLHAAAHVVEAIRLKVPAIVLIRDPVSACTSHVLRRPALKLEDSFVDYTAFYRRLDSLRDEVVIVPFEVLIVDYGSAMSEVNRAFGTDFTPYRKTDENEKQVRRIVEEMHLAERTSDGVIDELRVARPSAIRQDARDKLLENLDRPGMRRLVDEAQAIRATWIATSTAATSKGAGAT